MGLLAGGFLLKRRTWRDSLISLLKETGRGGNTPERFPPLASLGSASSRGGPSGMPAALATPPAVGSPVSASQFAHSSQIRFHLSIEESGEASSPAHATSSSLSPPRRSLERVTYVVPRPDTTCAPQELPPPRHSAPGLPLLTPGPAPPHSLGMDPPETLGEEAPFLPGCLPPMRAR